MATDNSVGGLYMRLGLSLDELETDFIAAERTTRENLNRLNRESNLIRLRAEVEIGNLDAANDQLQILTIRENALNEQLKIQHDRIQLASAAYQDFQAKHGDSAVVTQRAAAALEKEKLALQRLESELQNVRKAQEDVNKTQSDIKPQTKTNGVLDMYQNFKGDVGGSLGKLTSAFNDLKSASGSADGAITKSLEIIGSIPHPAGKAVAALASIPLVMHGVENSLIDIAKPAIAAGDAFYVMSRGMQMSIKDTAQLSMICKVTGIEISEVNSTLRRFSTQISKAGDGDNAMLKMLKRYGAEIRDTNGKIKNEIGLAAELGKALKKAQEEDSGTAFRDIVGGKFWSGDFITFLEDFADNVEQAKKVVKNGLANPVRAHALQGELNTLEAQAGQLSSAFSSAFMPIAEVLIPRTTQRMGELTKIIQDNAEGIKTLGMAIANILDGIETVVAKVGGGLISAVGTIGELYSPKKENSLVDKYALNSEIKDAKDLMNKELQQNYSAIDRAQIENNPVLYRQMAAQFENYYKAIEEARKQTKKSWADFKKDSEEGIKSATQATEAELEASAKRIEKYADELTHINIDLKFGKDDYGKSIAELDLWYKEALQKAENFEEEKAKITELYNAKREQLERRQAEKIQKIQEESEQRTKDFLQSAADIKYGLTHSAFEKQIYDIERWQEKSLEALDKYQDALQKKGEYDKEAAAIAAEARAKESEAFMREMDKIQGKIESAQDRLMRLTSSDRDYDLYKAQKQYQQDIKDGIPQGMAQAIYDATVKDINRRASEDKGGSYTRSKGGNTSNPYFIEFDKPKQTDWSKLNSKDLAVGVMQQKNQELANSCQMLINANNDLTQSANFTAQNLDKAAKGFMYIEGDKVVNFANDSEVPQFVKQFLTVK